MTLPKALLPLPHYGQDGSYVEYFYHRGQEWVSQIRNGTKRYAKFTRDGKWMTEQEFNNL